MTQTNPLEKVKRDLSRLGARTYRDATPYIYGQKYYYAYGFEEAILEIARGSSH